MEWDSPLDPQDFSATVRDIEQIISRAGIALGIDWDNESALRALAREALDHAPEAVRAASNAPGDIEKHAKAELFGMAELMLRTMAHSARHGIEISAGPHWKAFGRALWQENEARRAQAST